MTDLYQPAIQGGLGIIGNYLDGATRDYSQDMPSQSGFSSRRDIDSIRNREFEKEAFSFGDIGSGAAAGAAIGTIVPGLGNLAGAGIGAVAGLGSALLKGARQRKAENAFNEKKRRSIQSAMYVNSAFDNRDHIMRNLGQSSFSQFSRYQNALQNG